MRPVVILLIVGLLVSYAVMVTNAAGSKESNSVAGSSKEKNKSGDSGSGGNEKTAESSSKEDNKSKGSGSKENSNGGKEHSNENNTNSGGHSKENNGSGGGGSNEDITSGSAGSNDDNTSGEGGSSETSESAEEGCNGSNISGSDGSNEDGEGNSHGSNASGEGGSSERSTRNGTFRCHNSGDKSHSYTKPIHTTKGRVIGVNLKTVSHGHPYCAFRGIKYGRADRFKPPVEVGPWQGVLLATKDGSPCPQRDVITGDYIGNEDCLNLNVYAPQAAVQNKSELAVLVFIVEDPTFSHGYANSSVASPDFLIEENVVVVTCNHRLGALGFLSLQVSNASGNYGLKDQQLVLKWVRDNIRNFGGDPNKVTIVGWGGGAVSADLHGLSPKSIGLYRYSITGSGCIFSPWAYILPSVSVQRSFEVGKTLGYTGMSKKDLYEYLLKLPAQKLVDATAELVIVGKHFAPTIEDRNLNQNEAQQFLTSSPIRLYGQGVFKKHPRLLGYASNEIITFANQLDYVLRAVNDYLAFLAQSASHILRLVAGCDTWKGIPTSLKANITEVELINIEERLSSIEIIAGMDVFQRMLCTANEAPVYFSRLSYDWEGSLHRIVFGVNQTGAGYGDIVEYFFHMPYFNLPTGVNSSLSNIRRKHARLSCNFAKTGNPTPNTADDLLGVDWPDSRIAGQELDINAELTVHDRLTSSWSQLFGLLVASVTETSSIDLIQRT